jgi:hypothetical protein
MNNPSFKPVGTPLLWCVLLTTLLTGELKMPQIFKALATITVWVLFIGGWGYILSSFAQWAAVGFTTADWEPQAAWVALGTASFVLSVVVMKLRKALE